MVMFKEISFGFKSAEAERRRRPELLLEGFFEKSDMIDDLVNGAYYLVLGYKGSGKSAIAEHLALMSQQREQLFVDTILLRDFPYEQVPKVVPGEIGTSVRTNLAWSILLLLKLFESLCRDEGLRIETGADLAEIRAGLQRLNLIPKRKFRDLVLASREIDLGLELSKTFKTGIKSTYEPPIMVLSHVRDVLRDLVCQAVTESRHLLIIDGLDEVFNLFSDTYQTLASLVHEVDELNSEFDRVGACAKILLLCRTDLFERLPSANANKLRDYAVVLDWYHKPGDPLASDLYSVAHQRALLAGYKGSNVLEECLPAVISRSFGEDLPTHRYIMDHTRHTPRDFLQLLNHIQRETKGMGGPNESAILDGLREYSLNYFLPEVKDELAGYFDPDQVDLCFRIVGGLRRREFELEELIQYSRESGYDGRLDLREALRVLFDCSAVGNIVYRPRKGRPPGSYFTFRYRNRNASVNYKERFVLHRGVWKALNLA